MFARISCSDGALGEPGERGCRPTKAALTGRDVVGNCSSDDIASSSASESEKTNDGAGELLGEGKEI